MNRLEGNKDYLELKLENKAAFEATTGATEQDRFNNLTDDSSREEVISYNNLIDGSIAVGHYMAKGLSQTDATNYFYSLVFKSIEDNAAACQKRFDNKAAGWFPILFTYFSQATAQSIIDAIRDYASDYCNYAKFGTQYGDSEAGFFDFINNTGGVTTSLEDYPLLSGTDYTGVQTALTTYFRG